MINDMKILLFSLFVFGVSFSKAQSLSGTYQGSWAMTWFYYDFMPDKTVVCTVTGHYKTGVDEGSYRVSGDTIYVHFVKSDGKPYNEDKVFLIDGDSCVIDLQTRYDYCKTGPLFSSRERLIKYPQVQGVNDSIKEYDLKCVMEILLKMEELTKYYHFDKVPDRQFFVESYYAVNTSFPLDVEVQGKTARITNDTKGGFLIQFTDINQNPENIKIDFRLNEEGVYGWVIFKKIDGVWIKKYTSIKEE